MPAKPNPKQSPTKPPSIYDVDPTFEPWEPVKPIPIFLLAVTVALALTGVGMYLSDATFSTPRMTETPAVNKTVFAAPGPPSGPTEAAPLLVAQGRGEVWGCIACHGALGQGASITPRIAGLPRNYVLKQLKDFASGARHHDTMSYIAKALSDEDIVEISDYYASLSIPTLNLPPTDADLQRGRDLFLNGSWSQDVPACVTCHGPGGRGVGSAFPPLAGQQPDYLFSQLLAWKGGRRHNSPQELMDDIARRLSAEDLYAVSHYAASLSPQAEAASSLSASK